MWESGAPRSPRYDDLLTGLQSYDNAMHGLEKRIYRRLLKKYGYNSDIGNDVRSIFETPGKPGQFNKVIGDFGANAIKLGRINHF